MKKAMRIMTMVLFVVGMTALTSCSKSNEKQIIGKWQLTTIAATYEGQTFEIDVEDLVAMFGGEYDVEEVILEFKSDGKVYVEGEGIPYSINGDVLTIVDEEEGSVDLKILELTNSSMVLEGEEGGMLMTLTFKKV